MSKLALVFCLGFCICGVGHGWQQLDETEFVRLHSELNPQGAGWQTIPWMTSLIDAQDVSATQRKPIFIWAMDGHPLGCT